MAARPLLLAASLLGALLLVAVEAAASGHGGATRKRSFRLPVSARDASLPSRALRADRPSTRRELLRNATIPLKGAVKDYG